MNQRIAVSIPGRDPRADMHRRALRTLPARFRLGETDDCSVILLTDDRPRSLPTAALVAIDNPEIEVTASAEARLVPILEFAPRLTLDPVGFRHDNLSMVDVALTIADVTEHARRRAAIEMLAVLRRLISSPPALSTMDVTRHGFSATCAHPSALVSLTLTVACGLNVPPRLCVHAVSREERLEVTIHGEETARPAETRCFRRTGTFSAPGVFQSGLRLAWVGIHAHLIGAMERLEYGPDELLHDRREIDRWLRS